MAVLAISRRGAILDASALVGAASFAGLASAAEMPAASAEFGYSSDGYLWNTGFASRAEAVTQAMGGSLTAFQTAEIHYHTFRMPTSLAERVAFSHLDESDPLTDVLSEIEGANEEGDFEGEFSAACNCADHRSLQASIEDALSRALQRQGNLPYSAEVGIMDEGLALKLAEDAILEADLVLAVRAFIDEAKLEVDLRGLMTADLERHGQAGNAERFLEG